VEIGDDAIRCAWISAGLKKVIANEVAFGCFGAALDVGSVGGAGGFGAIATEIGVFKVEFLNGLKQADVFVQIGEGFAVLEALENAAFDPGADGSEKSVILLLVTNMGGSRVLG